MRALEEARSVSRKSKRGEPRPSPVLRVKPAGGPQPRCPLVIAARRDIERSAALRDRVCRRKRLSTRQWFEPIPERVLYSGLDQAALEFMGERPCRQSQRLVERKDPRRTGWGVADTDEFHGSKDGGKRSGAQTAVRIEYRAVCCSSCKAAPISPLPRCSGFSALYHPLQN